MVTRSLRHLQGLSHESCDEDNDDGDGDHVGDNYEDNDTDYVHTSNDGDELMKLTKMT